MTVDQGGESACFAHLVEEGELDHATMAQPFRDLADAVFAVDRPGTIVF